MKALQLVIVTAITMAFAAIALAPTFGMRVMIVLSGSMTPTFRAGDAVVAREVDPRQVRIDDVIVFAGYGTDHLTTHRVIDVRHVDGRLHFHTQGDANPDPDPNLAPAAGLHGRVRIVVPQAGRLLALLTDPNAKLLILGLPALHLLTGQLRSLWAGTHAVASRSSRPTFALSLATVLIGATITGATLVHVLADFAQTHVAGNNSFHTSDNFNQD